MEITRIFLKGCLVLILLLLINVVPVNSMPVILNTDIGNDIDDTWALALLLCSDELDLKLLVTEHGNTQQKAQLAAKFLEEAGRSDVPLGVGLKTGNHVGPLSQYSDDFDLTKYHGKVYQDGIAAINEVVQNATEPVTLLALGPFDNIPELTKRYPAIIPKIKVVAMGGSIYQGYNGIWSPDAEYNIRTNVKASRALFKAGWNLSLAPLDVTAQMRITGDKYQKLLESVTKVTQPEKHVVNILLANYRIWSQNSNKTYLPNSHSSILYDIIPVMMLIKPELFDFETMKLTITDAGFTKPNQYGEEIQVAMSITDKNTLIETVINRLSNGVLKRFYPKIEEFAELRKQKTRTLPINKDQFGLVP